MAKGKRETAEERVLNQYQSAVKRKEKYEKMNAKRKQENDEVVESDDDAPLFDFDNNTTNGTAPDLAELFALARSQMAHTDGQSSVDERAVPASVRPDWTFRYHLVAQQRHNNKSSVPLTDLPVKFGSDLLSALRSMGITDAFAIQRAVLPFLMPRTPILEGSNAESTPAAWAIQASHLTTSTCDVCVAAPTGQGKTLAFVLPLIHALKGRVVPVLRAFIVLPTKELAAQVHKVFMQLASRLSAAGGSAPIRAALLVGVGCSDEEEAILASQGRVASMPDVIVCTPGRMVEFLMRIDEVDTFSPSVVAGRNSALEAALLASSGNSSGNVGKQVSGLAHGGPCFRRVLTHLRYLVIDEADRALAQPETSWLAAVRRLDTFLSQQHLAMYGSSIQSSGLRKWLFSATLTHKAEHLAALALKRPLFFMTAGDVEGDTADARGFALPKELQQRFAICASPSQKIVVLAWRLLRHWLVDQGKQVIVFTATKETGHRLARILQLLLSLDATSFRFGQEGKSLADVVAKEDKARLSGFEADAAGLLGDGAEEYMDNDDDFIVHGSNGITSYGGVTVEEEWMGEDENEFWEDEDEDAIRKRKKAEKEARKLQKKADEKAARALSEEEQQRRDALADYQSPTARSLALLYRLRQASPELASKITNFSADLHEQTRRQILGKFARGDLRLLISSDVAARGLDVPGVDLVVNYDLPSNARRYVHRAGRTARAGQDGTVVSLVTPSDMAHLKRLVAETGGQNQLERITTPRRATEDVRRLMPACFEALKRVLDAERAGKVALTTSVSWGDKLLGDADSCKALLHEKMVPLWDLFYNPPAEEDEEDNRKELSNREKKKQLRAKKNKKATANDELGGLAEEPTEAPAHAAADAVLEEASHPEVDPSVEPDSEEERRKEEKRLKRKKEKEDARKRKKRGGDDD